MTKSLEVGDRCRVVAGAYVASDAQHSSFMARGDEIVTIVEEVLAGFIVRLDADKRRYFLFAHEVVWISPQATIDDKLDPKEEIERCLEALR